MSQEIKKKEKVKEGGNERGKGNEPRKRPEVVENHVEDGISEGLYVRLGG